MQKLKTIFAVFTVQLLWCHFIFWFLGIGIARDDISWQDALLFGVFIAPVWEELLYRHLPIQLGVRYFPKALFPIIIGVSIIFGRNHGSEVNILIQGVYGILFSYTYLRHGLFASIAQHMLWNFYCFFLK